MLLLLSCACLSKDDIVSKEVDWSSWISHEGFVPHILHRVVRTFGYLQNKGTSISNVFQTLDLRNFTTASQSRYRQSRLLTELARSNRRGETHVVYYTSVNRNAPRVKFRYFDLLWICCTTCSYSCSWQDFDWPVYGVARTVCCSRDSCPHADAFTRTKRMQRDARNLSRKRHVFSGVWRRATKPLQVCL